MSGSCSVPGPSRSKPEENQFFEILDELDKSTIPTTKKEPGPSKRAWKKAVMKGQPSIRGLLKKDKTVRVFVFPLGPAEPLPGHEI